MKKYILIALVVVVLLGLLIVPQYNSLVPLGEKVDSKWAQVTNQYQRRKDLMNQMFDTVQGEANFEKSTFVEIAEMRTKVNQINVDMKNAPATTEELKKFQEAQKGLSSTFSRLMSITENYPQLKANAGFAQMRTNVEGTENRLAVARMDFNQSVQEFNLVTKRFPIIIVAKLVGYGPRPYFEADADASVAPRNSFNFQPVTAPR